MVLIYRMFRSRLGSTFCVGGAITRRFARQHIFHCVFVMRCNDFLSCLLGHHRVSIEGAKLIISSAISAVKNYAKRTHVNIYLGRGASYFCSCGGAVGCVLSVHTSLLVWAQKPTTKHRMEIYENSG